MASQKTQSAACQALEMPRSSLYQACNVTAPRPVCEETVSPRALPSEEKAQIHQVHNSERFADQQPREVYATLLDEGTYLCSWRTMYRILDENQKQERKTFQPRQCPSNCASGHGWVMLYWELRI